jgi:hypothetical protein
MTYQQAANPYQSNGQSAQGPPAAPPPGWYSEPGGQGLRWWDGTQWGPQAQPQPPGQHPPGGAAGTAPGLWAWVVAAAPLVLLGVAILAAALLGADGTTSAYLLVGAGVADVLAIIAAEFDTKALRAAGEPVSSALGWWCLLVPWAYLWARAVKRTRKTGADWALFAGSVIAWLLVIVIAVPVTGSVMTNSSVFDRARAQADIAKGIKAQSGVTATVNCPQDPALNPGSQFQCVATASDGSTAMVTVTIQDRKGDYTWQTGA